MVAVLTPDAPDVLSHVSVRARNMHVLFATCHDPEVWMRVLGWSQAFHEYEWEQNLLSSPVVYHPVSLH